MAVEDNIEVFDDPLEKKSKWDISRMPCLRRGLINGIVGGLILGFGVFSYKRHVMRACDFAVGGFGVITAGSFYLCLYQHYQEKKRMQYAEDMLLTYSKQKGEEKDQDVQENSNLI